MLTYYFFYSGKTLVMGKWGIEHRQKTPLSKPRDPCTWLYWLTLVCRVNGRKCPFQAVFAVELHASFCCVPVAQ